MPNKRAAILIIGVLVCAPLLALYHFGFFREAADWLDRLYHQLFVLGDAKLHRVVPVQYAFYTAMAFVSAGLCAELLRASQKIAFLFAAVFLTLVLSPALAFNGVLFEPFSGVIAIGIAGVLGMIAGSTATQQRASAMRRFFIGRVSEDLFARMITSQEPPTLSGRREMTSLTCRLMNSSELSSELDALELEQLSSHFIQTTAEFLIAKGAYLESCHEDSVRVLFGFPLTDEHHAVTACRSAIELRDSLATLAKDVETRWKKKPTFGIAIATGETTTGLVGFSRFQFYSAVGDSLRFVDRLCDLNATYGSHILASNLTFTLAKDAIEVRPMEMVFAPKVQPLSEVYELLAEKDTLSAEEAKSRDAFWEGVSFLRKGDHKAATEHFNKARLDDRDDAPLRYFLDRAESAAKGEKTNDSKGTPKHAKKLGF